jgi:group I intron endonuclease
MKETGIYGIKCSDNGKMYVGSAVWISKRWSGHRCRLNNNQHHSQHLQNSWNKYGEKSFIFGIIELCDKSDLLKREEFWIEYFKALDREFGFNALNADRKNMSEETKKKISKSLRGTKRTEETKEKMRQAQQNRSKEWRNKISLGKKNKKFTKEHKQKLSKAAKRRWFSIKKDKTETSSLWSEEHKRKMSQAKIGKVPVWSLKSVFCVETGEVFDGIVKAAERLGVTASAISNSIRRKRKCKNYTFCFIEEITNAQRGRN